MLDSITKKRIDDLRNILVGKIPSPQSQVEQITTGLIYKFMYDMDKEAVDMGGVPSFFVNDFEKYSWKNLFDPKLSGVQKVQLYGDAIEHMYTNPTAPQLFREIFKNSFLPFKDPATLNMFLKEINEFHYSHSEKLGDAFEYLLSFMGSQGDAGQFRTPRHIIDFVVEIINPQKNESVLDPACGTAGFLISSYKHILNKNTKDRIGDKLTASDRKRIGENLVGYDISPDMTRISLVNMYLHQFANPQIHEYDTLSSEDRWNEYYDVILANPPFFSPTGGIQPHSRFGVKSTRAEVLFIDYIMEHLKPNGRAGIIVPEGIVFQVGTAYKTLRKKMIDDCLVGVISLPPGIFQPYSSVKTSILIFDKSANKKCNAIFFAKVESDGFTLGAQRSATNQNDLPDIVDAIHKFKTNGDKNKNLVWSTKNELLARRNCLLTSPTVESTKHKSNFEKVSIMDVCSFHRGVTYSKSDEVSEDGICVLRANNIDLSGQLILSDIKQISKNVNYREDQILKTNDIFMCIASGSKDHIGKTTLITSNTDYLFGGFMGVLRCSSKINPQYLLYILHEEKFNLFLKESIHGANINNIKKDLLADYYFPLPPIETQTEIVNELNSYQKIIDGCNQVISNYKPVVDIDYSWEMVELGELFDFLNGYAFKSSDFVEKGIQLVRMGNVKQCFFDVENNIAYLPHSYAEKYAKFILNDGDLIISMTGTTGKEDYGNVCMVKGDNKFLLNQRVGKFVQKSNNTNLSFYYHLMQGDFFRSQLFANSSGGARQANISGDSIKKIKVPYPDLRTQCKIAEMINNELLILEGNNLLIKNYELKITNRITKIWGE